MEYFCPVCGYKNPKASDDKPLLKNVCEKCCEMDECKLLWAIIQARKLGIIKEPVDWNELAVMG